MVDRHEDWLYNKRALHTWVTAQDPTTPHLHHRKFGICVSKCAFHILVYTIDASAVFSQCGLVAS